MDTHNHLIRAWHPSCTVDGMDSLPDFIAGFLVGAASVWFHLWLNDQYRK